MAAKRKITYTISRSGKHDTAVSDVAADLRRGRELLKVGNLEQAQVVLNSVISRHPESVDALNLLGIIATESGRPAEAVRHISAALEAGAGDATAYLRRGVAHYALRNYQAALKDLDHALALDPASADAHSQRANVLIRLGRLTEAVAGYDRAIALAPGAASAHGNRGNALLNLGRYGDALDSYERALALRPVYPRARSNRGMCRLLTGQFASGWQDYAARWDIGKHAPHPADFGRPVWDGQPAQATLLVWAEQGPGDQIMFASMLHEAAARVDRVMLALEPRLHALFARSFPEFRIVTFAGAIERGGYDLQIPIGGLGALLRHSSEDFLRNRRAYLKADPQRTADLRKAIGAGQQRICGLSWLSRNEEYGALKSVGLDTLRPLLGTPGWRFVDLQYGDTGAERAGTGIIHLDAIDNLQDIDGLAALVNACDVIVTVSNTTAHLAGALGKPVLLMLPHAWGRLWCWQTGREDALWYPEVRIFRQQSAGDWSTVVGNLCAALPTIRRTKIPGARALRPARGVAKAAESHYVRGNTLFGQQQFHDALASYDQALALEPRHALAHVNRGITLAQLGDFRGAIAGFDRGIALQPDNAAIHYKRASALRALNLYDEAIAAYGCVLAIDRQHARARNRRGICKLLTGRFSEGWRDYEARWDEWAEKWAEEWAEKRTGKRPAGDDKRIKLMGPADFGRPVWDGQPAQATLLVWAEQGPGDQIMFASMLHEAAARVDRVMLALEPRLHALFARSFPEFRIVTFAGAIERGGYDLQIPIGGLGALFRHSSEDFLRNRRAYLKADPQRTADLRKAIGAGQQRICGLSWLSRNEEYGALKSVALDTLRPLLGTPGWRFVDLQYGDTDAERAGTGIIHLDAIDNLQDIDGLAALVNACDVIVTVSNTTAHLAGALGKPVLLMLPHGSGSFWCWQAERADTLWYPHVRVLRQPASGHWAAVVAGVQAELTSLSSHVRLN